MKKFCTDCTHFKNQICTKNSKNGYNNCKKFKAVTPEDLKKERNALLLSKDNPERLKFLTEKLTNLNGGTL